MHEHVPSFFCFFFSFNLCSTKCCLSFAFLNTGSDANCHLGGAEYSSLVSFFSFFFYNTTRITKCWPCSQQQHLPDAAQMCHFVRRSMAQPVWRTVSRARCCFKCWCRRKQRRSHDYYYPYSHAALLGHARRDEPPGIGPKIAGGTHTLTHTNAQRESSQNYLL